jgi:hypothetical protein
MMGFQCRNKPMMPWYRRKMVIKAFFFGLVASLETGSEKLMAGFDGRKG